MPQNRYHCIEDTGVRTGRVGQWHLDIIINIQNSFVIVHTKWSTAPLTLQCGFIATMKYLDIIDINCLYQPQDQNLSSFQIYPLLLSFIIFAIDACFRLFVCKNCKEVTSLTSKNFHDNKRGMAINAAFSASPPDTCRQMLARTSFVFINWMFVVFIVSVTEDSGHWQVGLRQLIAYVDTIYLLSASIYQLSTTRKNI